VLIGAVPPLMVNTPANPGGLPIEVFDGLRKTLAGNRAQFYLDFSSGPLYGFNRPGVEPIPAVIQNWWRQAMMGGAKAQYDHQGILGDRLHRGSEDHRRADTGDARRRRPDRADRKLGALSAKLLKNGTLEVYKGFPHGMCTTHAETVNPDLLAFVAG
jgi:non-heme chloroperoxidase